MKIILQKLIILNFVSVLNKIQTQIALADIIFEKADVDSKVSSDVDSKVSSESCIVLVWEILRKTFFFKKYPCFSCFLT